MDVAITIGQILQFAATVAGAIVSGLAIRTWMGWKEEKSKELERFAKIEQGQADLIHRVDRTDERVVELFKDQESLERRVSRHEHSHIRLSTVVDSLLGKKPRLSTEGETD